VVILPTVGALVAASAVELSGQEQGQAPAEDLRPARNATVEVALLGFSVFGGSWK
jgi:hypothetical protein